MEKNDERGLDPKEVRRRLLERFEREGIKIVTTNPANKSRTWIEIKPPRK
jgi:hypothetical protein